MSDALRTAEEILEQANLLAPDEQRRVAEDQVGQMGDAGAADRGVFVDTDGFLGLRASDDASHVRARDLFA